MHLLWKPTFLVLLSVDISATNARFSSTSHSCETGILQTVGGKKPAGAALLQASTASAHLATSSVKTKKKATTQDGRNAWSAEMHDFGRLSHRLMADLYGAQQRSELSRSAAATSTAVGSEALLEQAEWMGDELPTLSSVSDELTGALPNLSSVKGELPSMPSLPNLSSLREPSKKEVETAIENAPRATWNAVRSATIKGGHVIGVIWGYPYTFLDLYLLSMIVLSVCLLPCLLWCLRHVPKGKTWRETLFYKIMPVGVIMLFIPLQLVIFEKLGFLQKTVELAEPFLVMTMLGVTCLLPLAYVTYDIVMKKIKPYLIRLKELERKLEAVTGVDLDGDGEVESLSSIFIGASAAAESETSAPELKNIERKKTPSKRTPSQGQSGSQQPRAVKKGCLAC